MTMPRMNATSPRPTFQVGDIRQAGLGREEPQHDDSTRMFGVFVAVVTAVYPIDHSENTLHQTLVDLQFHGTMPPWLKVPLGAPYAHGETKEAIPDSRRRQPKPPKGRGQMEGDTSDVRPGTRVLVAFPEGDLRAPVVIGMLTFNDQGKKGFPVERVAVDYFGEDGHFKMEEESPVHSRRGEYPRQRRTFNGTAQQIDNRGNYTLQTTIDRDPVFYGHNHIPPSPDPQGNVVFSTRGAKKGRIGRITGRHELTDEQSDDGTIRDETKDAKKGNWIVRIRSVVGRMWASTRGSGDGRAYVEDKKRSYWLLDGEGKAEIGGEQKVALDARVVCLGNDDPPFHAVLHETLNQFWAQVVLYVDTHKHIGVSSGEDTSGPPETPLSPTYMAYQAGEAWKSDVVKLVQSQSPRRNTQDDPDGE